MLPLQVGQGGAISQLNALNRSLDQQLRILHGITMEIIRGKLQHNCLSLLCDVCSVPKAFSFHAVQPWLPARWAEDLLCKQHVLHKGCRRSQKKKRHYPDLGKHHISLHLYSCWGSKCPLNSYSQECSCTARGCRCDHGFGAERGSGEHSAHHSNDGSIFISLHGVSEILLAACSV